MNNETKQHAELCEWLRANSSGNYRKSAAAADVIEWQAQALAEAREELEKLPGTIMHRISGEFCRYSDHMLGNCDCAEIEQIIREEISALSGTREGGGV